MRIARGINGLLERRGRVIEDRYHAHALKTPTEVRNARNYVLNNHQKHTGFPGVDEFSSEAQPQIVVEARTWLLTHPPPAPS